ncbi:XdhC family protein [Streptomyces sp. NPDC004596]|uniref:XdhC family protein n=1 Tax=Streptomyces sp. DSM 118148 TaxID=3448667 RepID=UPI0040401572
MKARLHVSGPSTRERSTVLDLRDQLLRWYEEGRAFAVATVVAVHGSAPRSPGSAMV